MPSHRARTRPPRTLLDAPPIVHDPETIATYLEDAAHYPGGHAEAVAFPKTEGEVAALVRGCARLLPIGAQSSVTGGATPMGEVVMSTSRLNRILAIEDDRVRVQPGVAISALQEALAAAGRYYPPFPTYTGAFVGGVVATNASGAGTFKYGSTRGWVEALTVVLPRGDVLDLVRGDVRAHPDGYFEIERANTGGPEGLRYNGSEVTRIPVPTYRMPDVVKRSAGYFAEPGMDLIDLFIGSEGTLGVITEITLRVLPRVPAVALALVFVPSEAKAVADTDASEIGQLMAGSFVAAGPHETRRFSPAGALGLDVPPGEEARE